MIDILQCGWKFPSDTVYVLGTGPNGVGHYHKIPHDAWVIGVNQAIDLNTGPLKYQPHDIEARMALARAQMETEVSIPIAIWLCADTTLPKQKWFIDQAQVTIDCEFELDNPRNPTPVFGTAPEVHKALTTAYPDVPYYFEHGYSLREPPVFEPMPDRLRAGGSVGAQGVQLAYHLGAKNIIICGIDMAGSGYFNGEENIAPRIEPDGTSKHLRIFQGLCVWLKGAGIRVRSLSPTALDVEVVGE